MSPCEPAQTMPTASSASSESAMDGIMDSHSTVNDPPMGAPIYQDLTLFTMPAEFRGRSAWYVQIWWIVQDTLFRWSPAVLFSWRTFLLRIFGAQIGRNVRLRSTVRVTYPWNLSIGDNVWVGDDCVFYNLAKITLGSNVALAHKVYLCTGLHDYNRVDFPIDAKPISIEDETWLTNDVFIGPGVKVSRGCVVGTRSTVLNDLPGATVCYGTPARPVKLRCVSRDAGQ